MRKQTTWINKVLACVNVVASAMANGTLTTRARVFASKVFPILTVKVNIHKSGTEQSKQDAGCQNNTNEHILTHFNKNTKLT